LDIFTKIGKKWKWYKTIMKLNKHTENIKAGDRGTSRGVIYIPVSYTAAYILQPQGALTKWAYKPIQVLSLGQK